MEVIEDLVQYRRVLPPAQRERPPPEDIRGWVVRLARLAGFRPWKRQPLPGNQVLWKAWKIVQICVMLAEAGPPGAKARRPGPRSPQPAPAPMPTAAGSRSRCGCGPLSLPVPDGSTVPAHPSIAGSDPESCSPTPLHGNATGRPPRNPPLSHRWHPSMGPAPSVISRCNRPQLHPSSCRNAAESRPRGPLTRASPVPPPPRRLCRGDPPRPRTSNFLTLSTVAP